MPTTVKKVGLGENVSELSKIVNKCIDPDFKIVYDKYRPRLDLHEKGEFKEFLVGDKFFTLNYVRGMIKGLELSGLKLPDSCPIKKNTK